MAVTIVEAAGRLLPLEEPEAGSLLADVFEHDGITVITGIGATRVDHDGQQFAVRLGDDRVVRAERLLVATGRNVDLAGIGADVLGIDPTAQALPVDANLRVGDRVWAVGDITGKAAFTHMAMHQASIAAADILHRPHNPASYHAVPRVTFTDPEVGSVGLSLQAAIDAGIDVGVGRANVAATARGWLHKAGNEGFITLIADRERGVLVGATAMGPNGGEVLGLLALAVHAAIPIDQLRTMIYAYPTFHRGVEDALKTLI